MGAKERVKAVETSCTFLQTHGRFAVHNGVDSSISSSAIAFTLVKTIVEYEVEAICGCRFSKEATPLLK